LIAAKKPAAPPPMIIACLPIPEFLPKVTRSVQLDKSMMRAVPDFFSLLLILH